MAVSGTAYNLRAFIILKIVSGHLVTSLFQCRVSFSLRVRFRVSFRVSSTTRVRLLGPYAWSCPNGLRLVFTAKLSLSQFSGIHESEKRSPNALGRPTAKSANYQA